MRKIEKSESEGLGVATKGRQTEASVRDAMLAQGALLLEFRIVRPSSDLDTDALRSWRSIEKKGFLVTKQGCLIPAPCHRFGNSKKKPAYEVALRLFWGKKRNPDTVGSVNEFGWPAEDQASHLCHDNACCAYCDLELVPQWKNLKRNYCGYGGHCDCGRVPECKLRYIPSDVPREYDLLRYGDEDLSKRVKGLFEIDTDELKVTVRILDPDCYRSQDEQRKHRNERIKRAKKHEAQRDKNEQRRKRLKKDPEEGRV